MKKFLSAIFICTILFAGCGTQAQENQPVESTMQTNLPKTFPTFKTTDLNNQQVSSDIFAQKKITVVNIWGTFCPPCIAEMPELAEWNKNISPDAQIIGLVCDIENSSDTQTVNNAKMILSQAGADFINILPNAEIMTYLQNVDAVPTTIFVDAQGNIIGEPVIGASVEEYKKRVEEFLK